MAKKPVKPAAAPAAIVPAAIVPVTSAADAVSPNLALDAPSARQYYQNLFITLKAAYWEASDIDRKDQVATARDEAYDILTALNEDDLDKNTAAFLTLSHTVTITNLALKQIQTDINKITRNITTGAQVLAAITKVLSIAPMFV